MRFEDHEAARRWKRAKLAQLSARIRLEESIFRSLRTERTELADLHGRKLTARFGWESEAELKPYTATMCGFGMRSRTFLSKPSSAARHHGKRSGDGPTSYGQSIRKP